MTKGIDVSTYMEMLERGKKYYDDGREVDPLDLFVAGGVDWMRVRIWCDPYDKDGKSYNAGDCTVAHMVKLAKLAADKGFHLAADLHYSDFWTDPKKQSTPKAWAAMNDSELKAAMVKFTHETLAAFKSAGVKVEMVQVGNEITNGMMWPHAKILGEVPHGKVGDFTPGSLTPRPGYDVLTDYLKLGIAAAREECPGAKILLHVEESGNAALYDEWFTEMQKAGVDYDVIGMSYYPFWHGPLKDLWANVDACRAKFGKEVVIAEWSYAFTLHGYPRPDGSIVRLSAGENSPIPLYFPYPATPEGQVQFVQEFLRGAREHNVSGVIYWEPLWLPGDGIKWASTEGLEYIGEPGKSCENEWANQCLADYEGHLMPAFHEYCRA